MIVLDTHAWIWWVTDPERIPSRALDLIDRSVAAAEPIRVSSISAWEVAMLVERGRLELTMDVASWIAASEALPLIEFVPVDNAIALRAVQLSGFRHPDPADRIIVATALGLGATLITGDSRLRKYRRINSAWR